MATTDSPRKDPDSHRGVSLEHGNSQSISAPPELAKKQETSWWPWSKAGKLSKVEENLKEQFSGKPGFKQFRRVYRPALPAGSGHPDPEPGSSAAQSPGDHGDDEGTVVKGPDGKYIYVNQFHQQSHKFDDVAVYLSPTNFVPKRLVVQASDRVLASRDELEKGDWIRSQLAGGAPVVLKVMLAIPGVGDWEEDEITDTYTEFPGYYWGWPKYAVNYLDMAPSAEQNEKPAEQQQKDKFAAALDVRRRAQRPRRLVKKTDHGWVEVDSIAEVDGIAEASLKARRLAERIAEREQCAAFWMDDGLVSKASPADTDYDVYTMCDVIRGASRVAIMLGADTLAARRSWGDRMWTLPEGLLAPGHSLLVCREGNGGQLVAADDNGRDSTEGGSATRVLAEHFSGLLSLSRLELLPAAVAALDSKKRNEFTGSDLAYAVMGLLHYRIQRRDADSLFQNLARLSLGNDSDQLVERMLCLLPKATSQAADSGVAVLVGSPVFEELAGRDEYETYVHHITPLCQVVGVAEEDETVIIDNCRAVHIRWKVFPRPVVHRSHGFRKTLAAFCIVSGLWWLTFSFETAVNYVPYWSGIVENVRLSLIIWVLAAFLLLSLLLLAPSPFSVRRLFGGTVLKSKPSLVAFEGVLPIAKLEKLVFGNYTGCLTYAPSATPFARDWRDPRERVGTEPAWLAVCVFAAERPPTVALLCGREGGMLRAVLCSWRFETDCLYRETVVRMPSRVYEAASSIGWLKFSLRSQNRARGRS
ncbi:hypothetical protein B0T26DRAFT_670976 [Lasiosphaeria miniovina]|uniref:Uncharacterized protein n=1 Tax=Lasiosphaeria miniovina TaxID=1954250 RepID=A0AA40EDU8_9PEZI|nr:uncharacterized protein B0T26DRAFT_670976 [Lasiosphaeria miniovina]KAK0734722.1 hypothetical protein B0T26DRAFT_670976 [Lasiosphaeria miniovina]